MKRNEKKWGEKLSLCFRSPSTCSQRLALSSASCCRRKSAGAPLLTVAPSSPAVEGWQRPLSQSSARPKEPKSSLNLYKCHSIHHRKTYIDILKWDIYNIYSILHLSYCISYSYYISCYIFLLYLLIISSYLIVSLTSLLFSFFLFDLSSVAHLARRLPRIIGGWALAQRIPRAAGARHAALGALHRRPLPWRPQIWSKITIRQVEFRLKTDILKLTLSYTKVIYHMIYLNVI